MSDEERNENEDLGDAEEGPDGDPEAASDASPESDASGASESDAPAASETEADAGSEPDASAKSGASSDAEAAAKDAGRAKKRKGAKKKGAKKKKRDGDDEADDAKVDEASASESPAKTGAAEKGAAGKGAAEKGAAEKGAAKKGAAKKDAAKNEHAPERDAGLAVGRTHLIRGGIITGLGFFSTFLLMANQEQIHLGPLYGILTSVVGVLGLLDLLGLFTPAVGERISLRETSLFAREGEPMWATPLVGVPLSILVLVIGFLVGGFAGLPLVILLALAMLVPAAIRRPALMVVVVASALYLPFLGAYGLWDPWETHYGEVAREILSRDDWISLWWAQEDWFWSKPILIFWMEALSMGALGVDFHPDANPLHPEWAIRLPHFLLVLGALLGVHSLVSRVWTKRAGLIAAVVLATMPHFFLLAHQAITDMPFVANMTMAVCMLGLALIQDPKHEVTRYGLGPISVSARHLVIGAISIVVVPQILYLISRNVSFSPDMAPFGWHGDIFMSGSAGNAGVHGNSPIHNVEPYMAGPGAQPVTQAIVWLLGYLGVLFMLRKERRAQSLYMFAFYLFCGLAFMAKGIPGFALPGLVALFFLIGSRRWELMLSGGLRVGAGILTVAIVGMPWYVAMFIRHGPPFTDRILIHDHINRLTAGVHGDTGSIEYFVEQMGYGMFPWIALAALALAAWLTPWRVDGSIESKRRRDVLMLVSLWLASAFTLFSAMTTKFHHYIFPVVPPAAILVGLAVDRLLKPSTSEKLDLRAIGSTVLALLSPVPAIVGVAGTFGDVRGIIPPEVLEANGQAEWALENPWPMGTCAALVLLGGALLAGAWWLGSERKAGDAFGWARGAVTTALLSGPVVLALVGRDLAWTTDARPQGNERLIHLFVYNYGRPWPEHFDYRPILTGFAIVATVVILVAAVRTMRDVATRAFIGVALAFCVWSLDVYIMDLSDHWGQANLVHRYYDLRDSAEEPLVAWQMNWKGENFYTGNHAEVFVQLDNQELRTWLAQNRGRTAFFLLEHARLGSLRGIMRDGSIEEMTTLRDDNKFLLIRARIGVEEPRAEPPIVRPRE